MRVETLIRHKPQKGRRVMRPKTYTCADCGIKGEFITYVDARKADWALSKDYKTCYCPECAPPHRLGGANKKDVEVVQDLGDGWEQLKILI